MKRTVKTVDRLRYIVEEFSSFKELLETNNSRGYSNNWGTSTRTSNNKDFYGASFEEAEQMLMYGWEDKEKVKQITGTINKLEKMQDTQKMSFKNDIVGFAPVVPLALLGVPQNMINCTRKPKKAKVINLTIEISVSASVSVEEKLDWGAKMVAKIMQLEKAGFRVRIDLMKVFSADDWRTQVHALKIPVKNENQPFDIKRMMFAIAHPAMQRKIAFDWYERLPEAEYISGHSTPLIHHSRTHREAVIKNLADTENSYFICCMNDIDETLKGVA